MTKILAYAAGIFIALLVAALGLSQYRLQHALEQAQEARSEATRYQGSYEAEKRLREAVIAAAEKAASVARKQQAADAQALAEAREQAGVLARALKDNKEWADTPIPDSVKEAIRGH